jgi:hypothetical protein
VQPKAAHSIRCRSGAGSRAFSAPSGDGGSAGLLQASTHLVDLVDLVGEAHFLIGKQCFPEKICRSDLVVSPLGDVAETDKGDGAAFVCDDLVGGFKRGIVRMSRPGVRYLKSSRLQRLHERRGKTAACCGRGEVNAPPELSGCVGPAGSPSRG